MQELPPLPPGFTWEKGIHHNINAPDGGGVTVCDPTNDAEVQECLRVAVMRYQERQQVITYRAAYAAARADVVTWLKAHARRAAATPPPGGIPPTEDLAAWEAWWASLTRDQRVATLVQDVKGGIAGMVWEQKPHTDCFGDVGEHLWIRPRVTAKKQNQILPSLGLEPRFAASPSRWKWGHQGRYSSACSVVGALLLGEMAFTEPEPESGGDPGNPYKGDD